MLVHLIVIGILSRSCLNVKVKVIKLRLEVLRRGFILIKGTFRAISKAKREYIITKYYV